MAARESLLKNVALFLAAPFIGLAYLIAFPFVAGAMLGWLALQAARKSPLVRTVGTIAKHAVMLVAVPFVGLAFIVLFPLVGLGALAWFGARSFAARHAG